MREKLLRQRYAQHNIRLLGVISEIKSAPPQSWEITFFYEMANSTEELNFFNLLEFYNQSFLKKVPYDFEHQKAKFYFKNKLLLLVMGVRHNKILQNLFQQDAILLHEVLTQRAKRIITEVMQISFMADIAKEEDYH